LAFDSCDVGAVLNVQPDHLGLKGINTVEDLAWVKSIVVEAVRRGGFSVLNADDPHTIRMQRRAGGRTVFFSLRGGGDMPGFLHRHVAEGGIAVVREPGEDGGLIVIHDGEERIPVIRADEIPATLEGLAEFNIANALAAVAVSFAHGVGAPAIRSALSTFTSSFEQTPGRLNVFDGHGFRVILDYAHNPTGLAALRDLVQKMRPQHHRAIGLIAIPGDRRDEDIRAMGEIASGCFDELMFREDPGTRGRNPGEVMRMMAEGALTAGMPAEHVHTVRHERDAVEICLRNARTADLVVLVVTEVDEVWRQILDFRPGRSEFRSGAPVEEASWSAAP
jgi:cyanophycin synthetase